MSFIKTKQQLEDYLMLTGVLPVIADKIEDLNGPVFQKSLKFAATRLIEQIRKVDNHILEDTGMEVYEQQHAIGLSFREWQKKHFNADIQYISFQLDNDERGITIEFSGAEAHEALDELQDCIRKQIAFEWAGLSIDTRNDDWALIFDNRVGHFDELRK